MKALQKGFTLAEMLIAASIACVFLLSVLSILAMSGKFFKIADIQALKTERSIIYYDTFTKIASKRLMHREYVEIFGFDLPALDGDTDIAEVRFLAIDMPEFIRLESHNSYIPLNIGLVLQNKIDTMFIQGPPLYFTTEEEVSKGHHGVKYVSIIRVRRFFSMDPNRRVYFKPVYVGGYKHKSDKGDGWTKGDLLPFSQKIFDELIQEKKNGNVSRIYLIIK